MITSDIVYRNRKFERFEGSGLIFSGSSFTSCVFVNCDFSRAQLNNCYFEDCTFEDSNLSMFTHEDTAFNKVLIKNSRVVGISWAEMLPPFFVRFENSDLSYSSFYAKSIRKSQFINCSAEEVDFSECDLSQSNFSGTDLTSAQFYNTKLLQCNFETATNYSIDTKYNTIDGAKFSLPEALSFFKVLNIDVRQD